MKKEVAEKWVAALRSGKYEQDTGFLQTHKGYCCLGVLCDISGLGIWQDSGYCTPEDASRQVLPLSVKKWAGMNGDEGQIKGKTINYRSYRSGEEEKTHKLTVINDEARWNFASIADLIEKEWENL